MLNQKTQSMTKTKTIMDSVNNSVGGSKDKMGASATTTNNSSSNAGGSGSCSSSSGTNTTSTSSSCSSSNTGGKNNEPGSQTVYQSGGAEHLPKLLSILPAVTQCTYTSCYW